VKFTPACVRFRCIVLVLTTGPLSLVSLYLLFSVFMEKNELSLGKIWYSTSMCRCMSDYKRCSLLSAHLETLDYKRCSLLSAHPETLASPFVHIKPIHVCFICSLLRSSLICFWKVHSFVVRLVDG
jgi:hypothetical protein